MMSKKTLLSKIIYMSYLLPFFRLVRSLFLSEITILAYHRIVDIDSEFDYPFDVELISASCDDFRWQVNYLKKNYTPITFSTLIHSMEMKKKLPRNPIIITFDDGFDDNYLNAYQVLNDLNIPATFFISTGYIGRVEPFWFDWVVFMLKSTDEWDNFGIPELNVNCDSNNKINQVLRYLKKIPNDKRILTILKIEQHLGMKCHETGFTESRVMNWSQINEMSENGMEFGSHTISHPVLSKLNDEHLWNEINDSKTIIEEQLGKECEVIAYPVGGRDAFDGRVFNLSKKANYKLAVSYISGINKLFSMEEFELKRLHVERYTSRASFASMLVFPELLG